MADPNHHQERILRPIYNFLDTYNYTKALKLTHAKPQNKWPITIALRAHCLERIGRKLDACRELRVLLSVFGDDDTTSSGQTNGNGAVCKRRKLHIHPWIGAPIVYRNQ